MTAEAVFAPVLTAYFDAYAGRDAAGCAAAYTENATLYSPFGPPAQGRAAITATHDTWFEEDEQNKTWGIIEAQLDGKLGHCLIWFQSDAPTATGMTTEKGVSLSAFERTEAGWKIRIMSLNMLEQENAP